jgi:NADH-quinone oxidoreductase subunit L
MSDYIWLIPVLPLMGFIVNGLLGKQLGKRAVSVIGVGVVGLSLALAAVAFFSIPLDEGAAVKGYYTWISVGDFSVDVQLRLDQLSMVMVLVVTGVGFLIHLYSVGYMHGEEPLAYARYFSYVNLFTFAMLVLVMADNFLLMFVGWEGVGLCSYLLIGFWYVKDSAADAGKKAFIVNRIGDAGFLLGIFTIFAFFGTLDFDTVLHPANAAANAGVVPWIALALFIGAVGKSAQIPLYVWLPDAMEGPTPVSALIHAATMVTAGVYMVVRCNVLYFLTPDVLLLVGTVGAVTAIFAATIGLAQNDIKRVLAYSTVSQLGYMFFACGVGAFGAAIFHLMTHAFFKACLFLCSGSVIHGMHGEQDMRQMGGLKALMPITYITMLISTLAIAGIPPFAGFFSKDAILWAAVESGQSGLWFLGAAAALLTAFYMFRLMHMTFSGTLRAGEEVKKKVHESPPVMTVPLVVLAALATVGGFIGFPAAFQENFGLPYDQFGSYLEPVIRGETASHLRHSGIPREQLLAEPEGLAEEAEAELAALPHEEHDIAGEWIFMAVSVALALVGWLLARWLYKDKPPDILAEHGGPVHTLLANKYYVDELYDAAVVQPVVRGSDKILYRVVDAMLIDGIAVDGSAKTVNLVGRIGRLFQNGYVQTYLFFFLAGVLVLLSIIL